MCGVELTDTLLVQLLVPFPELDRLVEAGIAALEPLDDLLQLALGFLERHSTRAPKCPSATSTSTCSPDWTIELERTISSRARTIEYPRGRVARGERARGPPAASSSRARLRSTA